MSSKDIDSMSLLIPYAKKFVELLEPDDRTQEMTVRRHRQLKFPLILREKIDVSQAASDLKSESGNYDREYLLFFVFTELQQNLAGLANNFSNFQDLISAEYKKELDSLIDDKAKQTSLLQDMFQIHFNYNELFEELLCLHWQKLQDTAIFNDFLTVGLNLDTLACYFGTKISEGSLTLDLFNNPTIVLLCAFGFLALKPEILDVISEALRQQKAKNLES